MMRGMKCSRLVGTRLQLLMRGVDVAARLGGDEFCVVADDCADVIKAVQSHNASLKASANPYNYCRAHGAPWA